MSVDRRGSEREDRQENDKHPLACWRLVVATTEENLLTVRRIRLFDLWRTPS